MEMALRRHLEGVADVTISMSEQTTEVRFTGEGVGFDAATFREAVGTAGVEVERFEIDACGTVAQEGDERWLHAGKHRYRLTGGADVPPDQPVCVTGRLVDRPAPERIEVATVRAQG